MSPTTIEDSQLTEASAPFNRTDGDVILLSSDQVKFSCHKAILAISSPFFSDMFSLPAAKQADLASNDQPALADGTPIIPITETSKVIDTLLRSIYPVAALPLYDIAVIAEVLHAGRKYQMPEGPGIAALSRAFDSFTVNDPLRVFFISCRFGMEEKAAATARWLLLVTPILSELRKLIVSSPGDIPEAPGMNYATAGSFFRLRWYLKEGGKVNGSFRFLHPSPLDGTTQPSSDSSDTSSCASTGSNESSDDTTSWLTSSGLLTRLPADIHIRSLIDSTVDIPSHKFILALSSPVLADEISRATVNAPDSLPAIFLPESGELISHLLRCCYGSFASLFIDSKYLSVASETLVQVVDAAKKYSMDKVVEAARIILQPYLSADPIPAYYVSVACGWEREAREAARHSVDLDAAQVTDTYASQMENCTAVAYLRLLGIVQIVRMSLQRLRDNLRHGRRQIWQHSGYLLFHPS